MCIFTCFWGGGGGHGGKGCGAGVHQLYGSGHDVGVLLVLADAA